MIPSVGWLTIPFKTARKAENVNFKSYQFLFEKWERKNRQINYSPAKVKIFLARSMTLLVDRLTRQWWKSVKKFIFYTQSGIEVLWSDMMDNVNTPNH